MSQISQIYPKSPTICMSQTCPVNKCILKGIHFTLKYAEKTGYSLNYHFEQGIVKLQKNNEDSLTIAEREAVAIFRTKGVAPSQDDLGYADNILAAASKESSRTYRCCDHVVPTSNIVERLFSACKRTMTDYRKVMDPSMLDTLMFLGSNSDLWMRDAEVWIDDAMKVAAEAASARRLQQKNTVANTPTSILTPISSAGGDFCDDDTYTF